MFNCDDAHTMNFASGVMGPRYIDNVIVHVDVGLICNIEGASLSNSAGYVHKTTITEGGVLLDHEPVNSSFQKYIRGHGSVWQSLQGLQILKLSPTL